MPASRMIENHPEILKHDEILKISEVESRLHGLVGRQAVEGWVREGFDGEKLRTALIGRVRITSVSELDRFLLAINGKLTDEVIRNEPSAPCTLTPKQRAAARAKYKLPTPEGDK